MKTLAEQNPTVVNRQPAGPFVLSHLDLRCGNIIVPDDLRILGIIDWEFAGTIPLSLFTSPAWITGHKLAAGPQNDSVLEFHEALKEKSSISSHCAQLLAAWNDEEQLTLPVAHILRHPSTLMRVYYKFIFRRLFHGQRDEIIAEFFGRTDRTSTAALVEQRIKESQEYTHYLLEEPRTTVCRRRGPTKPTAAC